MFPASVNFCRILPISGGERNWAFLILNHLASLCHSLNKIGLSRQERRQLQDVGHLANGFCLIGFMHISDDRHFIGFFYPRQNSKPLFKPRTSIGVDRGAIGLVKRCLEDIWEWKVSLQTSLKVSATSSANASLSRTLSPPISTIGASLAIAISPTVIVLVMECAPFSITSQLVTTEAWDSILPCSAS